MYIHVMDEVTAVAAGQFFQNTNWFMTGIVLAWVAVTIGYIIVRATQSLAELSTGRMIWGIWVLIIEVSLPSQPPTICTALLPSVSESVCHSFCRGCTSLTKLPGPRPANAYSTLDKFSNPAKSSQQDW